MSIVCVCVLLCVLWAGLPLHEGVRFGMFFRAVCCVPSLSSSGPYTSSWARGVVAGGTNELFQAFEVDNHPGSVEFFCVVVSRRIRTNRWRREELLGWEQHAGLGPL